MSTRKLKRNQKVDEKRQEPLLGHAEVDDKDASVLGWDRHMVIRLYSMQCACDCGRKCHQTLAYFPTSFLRNFRTQSHLQKVGFYFPFKINALGLTIPIYCAFLATLYKKAYLCYRMVMPTFVTE